MRDQDRIGRRGRTVYGRVTEPRIQTRVAVGYSELDTKAMTLLFIERGHSGVLCYVYPSVV